MRRLPIWWVAPACLNGRRPIPPWQHPVRPSLERGAPAFLIIGQMKAGTTALYSYLCRHPRVVPAMIKEVQYWSRYYEAGEAWYRAHFMPIPPGSDLITGEASPTYFADPDAPARIARVRPDMRLILLLRDPVARAYSAYRMRVRLGREQRSWEAVVDSEIAARPICPLDEAGPDVGPCEEGHWLYLLRQRGAALSEALAAMVPAGAASDPAEFSPESRHAGHH